jgi:primosomal protein N' (replication factor Y) (superfamily II helicase)
MKDTSLKAADARQPGEPVGKTAGDGAERSFGVLLTLPLPPLDYRLDDGMEATRGTLVAADLSGRKRLGALWTKPQGGIAAAKLKTVAALPEGLVLPARLCDFIDWVAGYTMAPAGMVLAMGLRSREALAAPRPRIAYVRGDAAPAKLSPAREKVLKAVADGFARPLGELAAEAGVTPAVVKGLAAAGALKQVALPECESVPAPDPDFAAPRLNEEQSRAAAALTGAVADARFHVALIDGITGSGKTETYFEAVAETLRRGHQVLILLPEIALTMQFLERFAARFGGRPVEWHSDLTPRERKRTWRSVYSGEARAVVGARSALFLPFCDLGLIVADEEHESAYKQEEGVLYHARDMAVVRGSIENCPVVLASATPSLESYANAASGRYAHLRLTRRHGIAELPEVKLIDLRGERGDPGTYLSPALRDALKTTLAAGEQAMLFLNRRGFAPLTLCESCGHKMICRNCSAWLVEHKKRKRLVCHHCGFEMPLPETCPQCGEQKTMIPCGPGVERVAEEFQSLFPDARAAIASSDTMEGPQAMQSVLSAMA